MSYNHHISHADGKGIDLAGGASLLSIYHAKVDLLYFLRVLSQ